MLEYSGNHETPMTARLNSFTVVLEDDMREDDAENIKNAILMLRGVLTVEGNEVDCITSMVERNRLKAELFGKLRDIV